VLHLFYAGFQTPKGRLVKCDNDPKSLRIESLQLNEAFAKYTFLKRRSQEIAVGKLIGREIGHFKPDVVISSNAPLDTQRQIMQAAKAIDAKFIFWVQDIYSHAISKVLKRKIPVLGNFVGLFYRWLEAKMINESDHTVLISADFEPAVRALAGPKTPTTVIENWAPLEEIRPFQRDNDWAIANLQPARFRFIYSGTIGFKHNPDLLISLAESVEADVVVFSEGEAADYLKKEAEIRHLSNLKVSGWLPFEDLPKALASADALLVILEPEAGIYSVPSKTLTYMCVGRPILGAIASENLAARLIDREAMGFTVRPDDVQGFVNKANDMVRSSDLVADMGSNARAYAEKTFDIESIATRFERIISSL